LCYLFLVQKRSGEGAKQGMPIKKVKKDKGASATGKAGRPEANTVPMAPRVKPELTLPVVYFLESSIFFFISH
jgi:transcription initiation factor TFIID subunit 5